MTAWIRKTSNFYPRDAVLARVLAVVVCESVCLSHAGIVSQELITRWDSERELLTTIGPIAHT